MATRNADRLTENGQRVLFIYGLAVFSAATGGILAMREVLPIEKTVWMFAMILVVWVGVPLLMGYLNRGFAEGTLTGILPAVGYWAGAWFWQPVTDRIIYSMVFGGFHAASVTLPIAGLIFIFGVGLRRDGTIHDRNKELAIGMGVAFLLFVVVDVALATNLIFIGGDQ